jgi:hypothetical protein
MAPLSNSAPGERPIIEWGWAGSALEGQSGDLHVVVPFCDGALVALVDGLGHGPEAAAAANAAASLLEIHASDPVLTLMRRCHTALRQTRGAVMSLASFNARDSSISWTGVGNVDGVLLRLSLRPERLNEAIMVRGGVVGYQLPPLQAKTLPVFAGDTLIMTTDGIRGGFSADIGIEHDPQEIAESILARFAKKSDDAHVVVARYRGSGL